MEKKRTVQRISNKKRGKPKVRFNFMIIVIIVLLTFAACFVFYMISANINGDALDDDDDSAVPQTTASAEVQDGTEPQTDSQQPVTEAQGNITYPLPQSEEADSSYFDNCCLITDSTLLSMSKYTDLKDVLGSSSLGAGNCNEMTISSTYGNVTPYQTIQLKKPGSLYIMLGSDLGAAAADDLIQSYTTLVSNLHNYLPGMKIYIMQLPPVPAASVTVTNDMVNDYNTKLLNMAKNLGVYCIDTNTALRGADGSISEDCWDSEGNALSSSAYKAIAKYILNHTV